MATSSTRLTKKEIQTMYPEIFDSYILQMSVSLEQCEDRLAFWASNGILCFENWAVPYFLQCENEKKCRPCLRLNYPYDGGKCNECAKGACKYDSVCFMCGQKGHGAFQTFPAGKLKGELKCIKHRNFVNQLEAIQKTYGIDDVQLRDIFATPTTAAETSSSTNNKFKVTWTKKPAVDSMVQVQDLEQIDITLPPSDNLSSSSSSLSVSNMNSKNNNSNGVIIEESIPSSLSLPKQSPPRSVWGNTNSIIRNNNSSNNIIISENSISNSNSNHSSNNAGNNNSSSGVSNASSRSGSATVVRSISPPMTVLPLSIIELGPSVWSTPSATASNKQYQQQQLLQDTSTILSSSNSRRDSISSPFVVGSHTPFSSIIINSGNNSFNSGSSSIGGSSSSAVLDALRSLTPLPSSPHTTGTSDGATTTATINAVIGSSRKNSITSNNINNSSSSSPFLTINTDFITSDGINSNSNSNSNSIYSNRIEYLSSSNNGDTKGTSTTAATATTSTAGNVFVSVDVTSIDDFHLGYSLPNSNGDVVHAASNNNNANSHNINSNSSSGCSMSVTEAATVTLRYAPWLTAHKCSPGTSLLSCKGVLLTAGGSSSSSSYHEEITLLAWPQQQRQPSPHNNNSHTTTTQQQPPQVDLLTLSKELKILRSLARSYSVGIARVLSSKPLPILSSSSSSSSSSDNGGSSGTNGMMMMGMNALLSEYSDIGYLDQFVTRHVRQHPTGFALSDLRCCAVMFTDALLHCHRSGVSHRDLRPSTVLVTRPVRYQRDLLLGQFNLKLCDFRLGGLNSLYNTTNDEEQERFTAPEVTAAMRNSGVGYDSISSDVWSLGMVMYYLGTGGKSMVEQSSQELLTPNQVQQQQQQLLLRVASPSPSSSSSASALLLSPTSVKSSSLPTTSTTTTNASPISPSTTANTTATTPLPLALPQLDPVTQDEQCQQHYRQLSQRHSLQCTHPLLHDFIDRTIRPSTRRIHTTLLRCHPLMWPLSKRRDFLLAFTHTNTATASSSQSPGLEDYISNSSHHSQYHHQHHQYQQYQLEPFLSAFEKFAPGLVFEGNGWIQHMPVHLLNQVMPVSVKNELWWSGRGLLQAIRSHLLNLETLNATVYPQLTAAQTLAVYMREMTEQCYPRLLSLLFELGGALGQWHWDSEEVTHKWR